MKKNFLKIFSVTFILSLLFFVAAACVPETQEPEYEFTGLDVPAAATVEAYTDYTFLKPDVKYGEEKATVSVSVKKGDETIANDGTSFFVESVGKYTVTYTAACKGKTQSATTELNAADTTPPVVKLNAVSGKIKYYTELMLNEAVTTVDPAGVKSGSLGFEVFDMTGGEEVKLTAGYDETTTKLKITDGGVKKIRIKASATDNNDNTATVPIDLDMIDATVYGKYDFSKADTEAESLDFITFRTTAKATLDKTEVKTDEDEKKYAEFTVTTAETNQAFNLDFDPYVVGDFGAFDYVEMDVMATATANGGNGGLNGEYQYFSNGGSDIGNIFAFSGGEWKTVRIEKSKRGSAFDALKNGSFSLALKPWGAQTVTFAVKEIRGGYDNILANSAGALDLTERLGLKAGEFTAEFNSTEVEDVTAFTIDESGTLELSVNNKSGYVPSAFSIGVTFDNIAPEIVQKLSAIPFNKTLTANDLVSVTDAAGLSNVTYELFDMTSGSEVALDWMDEEAKSLRVGENSGITALRIKVNATDMLNNSADEATLDFELIETHFAAFDFMSFKVGGAVSGITATVQSALEVVSDPTYGKVLHYFYAPASSDAQTGIYFTKNLIGDFSKFDYVDVTFKMSVTKESGAPNGWISLGAAYSYADGFTSNFVGGGINANSGEWVTLRFSNPKILAAMANDSVPFIVCTYGTGNSLDLKIAGIKGGYKNIVTGSGETIDLTEKLKLSANEFTAEFEGAAVADVTAFVPDKAGTLTVTVVGEGFVSTDMEIEVEFDGEGPEVSASATSIAYNTTINLDEIISATDASEVESVSYSVFDISSGSEEELTAGYNPTDESLRISDAAVTSVRIKVTAADTFGNVTNKSFDLTLKSVEFGALTFDGMTSNNNQVAGVNYNNAMIKTLEIATDETYGDVLHYTGNAAGGGAQFTVNFDKSLMNNFAKFDYVDVTFKMTVKSGTAAGNGWISLGKSYVYADGFRDSFAGSTNANSGEWVTLRYSNPNAVRALGDNNMFIICVYGANSTVDVSIANIRGGYNKLYVNSDTALNLADIVGVGASELTATYGGTAVADVTAFTPSGTDKTLTLNVNKEGFAEKTYTDVEFVFDDDAPIATAKADKIKYGVDTNRTDLISVTDENIVMSETYEVFDISSGTEVKLTAGYANNKFNITDRNVTKIRIKVTATDRVGNSATRSVDYDMIAVDYNVFDFYGVTASQISAPANATKEIAYDDDGKPYFHYYNELTAKGTQYATATFTNSLVGRLKYFDYVDIKLKLEMDRNGAIYVGTEWQYFNGWTSGYYTNVNKKGWVTARSEEPATMSAFGGDWRFIVAMFYPNDAEATGNYDICIQSITGGYKDMTVSDTAVDLTAKFGLTESEFTATFDGANVADVKAFVPNKAGTLSVTVKKAGYSDTKYTINVVQGE